MMTGVSRSALTCFLLVGSSMLPETVGFCPLASATASFAVASASFLTALYTVMHWSPSRMCCRPWTVASCPVTGTWPLRLFFFSTEMTEFAMPSLATRTPLMSLLAVSICSKIVPSWVLSLAGTAVQVDDHEDVDALGDQLVGEGLEGVLVTLGVLDVGLDAGVLERLLQVRPVGAFPAGRRLAVGQDHPDERLLATAAAGTA